MSKTPDPRRVHANIMAQVRHQIEHGPPEFEKTKLDLAFEANDKPKRRGPFIPVHVADTGEETYTQVDIERFRQGYGCLVCREEFAAYNVGPLPDKCPAPWCDFQPRKYHTEFFAKMFAGNRRLGSEVDENEETQRMRDHLSEHRVAQGLRERGVWIPRSI